MLLAPALAKSGTSGSTGDTIKCTSMGALTPALRNASQTSGPDGEIRHVVIVHDVEMDPVGAGGEHRIHFLAQAGEIGGQNRRRDDDRHASLLHRMPRAARMPS